jgi:hypothetical protein
MSELASELGCSTKSEGLKSVATDG